MTTGAQTATDVVRAYFDALQQGQFQSLGAIFADDVRWHQPGHGTLSGVYTGKAAVFELFGKFMQLSGGTFAIDQVDTIMENGDLVAAALHFHARRGTEQIAINGVDVMRVRDGKSSRCGCSRPINGPRTHSGVVDQKVGLGLLRLREASATGGARVATPVALRARPFPHDL